MKNSGLKLIIVILVVVCLFQGGKIMVLTSDIDFMLSEISDLQNYIYRLEDRIEDLEQSAESEGMQIEVDFGLDSVDWEEGVLNVEFSVSLADVNENTVVTINNKKETVILTKSNGQFVGKIAYPLDNETYETIVYKYNGDSLVDSETIDWFGAQNLMAKYIMCEFSGFAAYGNGKLTLAGDVDYVINVSEKVTSAELVFEDERVKISDYNSGRVAINSSKNVDETADKDGNIDINSLYLQVDTESGIVFRAYPEIYARTNYEVIEDEDMDGIDVEYIEEDVYQNMLLEVITPSGKNYKISIIY